MLYTYTAKRVFLFASHFFYKTLRPFTLERDEYNKYSRAVANVLQAVYESGFKQDINLKIRPFTIFFLFAFYRGAYRSPIVILENKVFSGGEIPNKEKLKEELVYLHSKERFLKD